MDEIRIDDMGQLLKEFNQLPNNFIYRGHANAAWPLQSSLERLIGAKWSANDARMFEDYSLGVFRAKFHLYDRDNVMPDSKLSWLAAMQHYGVPTRLVDFTASPYVALYFALEAYQPAKAVVSSFPGIGIGALQKSWAHSSIVDVLSSNSSLTAHCIRVSLRCFER